MQPALASTLQPAATAGPGWRAFVGLPLLHFLSLKLTFFCAVSPENEVVVWLPNAVLLAALLHWRGQRGWLFAALAFGSDVIGNLPVFPPLQALLLSGCNLVEVTVAYLLIRRAGGSTRLEMIGDVGRFVVAGPLCGALAGSLLAGLVLANHGQASVPYAALVLLWWFGDALGLLIYTPLLLAFAGGRGDPLQPGGRDIAVVVVTAALAALIFSGEGERLGGVPLTPNLLLPSVLYMAVRFGTRWTLLAVALISLATAWAQTTGQGPFGSASPHELILRAQEFILTLSIVGMGFAALFAEQKALTRSLEDKVRARTLALEESNSKLGALSTTDGLTGIANRRRFDEFLAEAWEHGRRSGQPLALVLLDVDLFKPYNDCYGHRHGDDCLRAIARVLASSVRRSGDLVARYGGEEFAFVAPGADEPGMLAMAQQIREAVERLQQPHALSPFGRVTASLGVAVLVPQEPDAQGRLVELADRALYRAKAEGRNRVVSASA